VVGIFPNPDSYLRLVTVYLMEYSEDWSVTRGYLSEDSLKSLVNRQRDMVNGVQSCELDLTVPEIWYSMFKPLSENGLSIHPGRTFSGLAKKAQRKCHPDVLLKQSVSLPCTGVCIVRKVVGL
jgi:hypothetical protein